ncbi:MAG TPA: thioredoxin family protein [Polyangiaceae bacterium]
MAQGLEELNESNFDASVLKAEVPVLVEFGATWCGPCRALEPMLTKLAAKHAGSKVVTVDVDDSPGLATQYGVRGVPTVIVFAKGKEVARQVGLAAESRFASMMDAAKV